MIVVAEPQLHGDVHVPFNAALLASVRLLGGSAPVLFLAEGTHLKLVREYLRRYEIDTSRIEWSEVDLSAGRAKGRVARLREQVSDQITCMAAARRHDATRMVLASSSVEGLLATHLLASFWKLPPIWVVPHGALDRLNSPSWLVRAVSRLVASASRKSGVTLVLLSRETCDSLVRDYPQLRGSVCWIDHPYLFRGLPRHSGERRRLRFGFLGVASRAKGFPVFLQLAREAGLRRLDADFIAVGYSKESYSTEELSWLTEHPASEPLPRERFEEMLGTVDFAIVPYEPARYRYVASGVFMDCLSFGIPILTVHGTHFADAVAEHCGLGEVLPSEEALSHRVAHLASAAQDISSARGSTDFFLRLREKHSIANVSRQLGELLGLSPHLGRK